MLRDPCLGCQYRYSRTNFQRGWIEHPLSLGNEATWQLKNLAIRCALHVAAIAADRVGNTLYLYARARTTMLIRERDERSRGYRRAA